MTFHLTWTDLINGRHGVTITTVAATDRPAAVSKLIEARGLSGLSGWSGHGHFATGGGYVYSLLEVAA
jgi:hypothetical protein